MQPRNRQQMVLQTSNCDVCGDDDDGDENVQHKISFEMILLFRSSLRIVWNFQRTKIFSSKKFSKVLLDLHIILSLNEVI